MNGLSRGAKCDIHHLEEILKHPSWKQVSRDKLQRINRTFRQDTADVDLQVRITFHLPRKARYGQHLCSHKIGRMSLSIFNWIISSLQILPSIVPTVLRYMIDPATELHAYSPKYSTPTPKIIKRSILSLNHRPNFCKRDFCLLLDRFSPTFHSRDSLARRVHSDLSVYLPRE